MPVRSASYPHVLHEQGEEEEHAEQRGADAQADQVGTGPVPAAQHPDRHQRMLAARLDDPERGEQDHGHRQRHDHLGVAPVRDPVHAGRGVGQPVDERGQAERGGDRARQVKATPPPVRFGQDPGSEERDHEADRHVHEEHPAPAGELDQQAARDQADGAAGHAHRRVHAHRAVARRSFGERDRDQRQGGRRGERGADALDDPRAEQPRLVGGEPAGQRGQREQQDAGDEDPAAPQ